jgi:hypothetical protein
MKITITWFAMLAVWYVYVDDGVAPQQEPIVLNDLAQLQQKLEENGWVVPRAVPERPHFFNVPIQE